MRLHGRYFELSDRFSPDQRRPGTARAIPAGDGVVLPGRAVPCRAPRLIISVPKRLLRSAVRRNAVKRVVRESWRLAPQALRARFAPPAVLVRLVRQPADGHGRRPSLVKFKQQLRVDVDALWHERPAQSRGRRPPSP